MSEKQKKLKGTEKSSAKKNETKRKSKTDGRTGSVPKRKPRTSRKKKQNIGFIIAALAIFCIFLLVFNLFLVFKLVPSLKSALQNSQSLPMTEHRQDAFQDLLTEAVQQEETIVVQKSTAQNSKTESGTKPEAAGQKILEDDKQMAAPPVESEKKPESSVAVQTGRPLPAASPTQAQQPKNSTQSTPKQQIVEVESKNMPTAKPAAAKSKNMPTAKPTAEKSKNMPTAKPTAEKSKNMPTAKPTAEKSKNMPAAKPTAAKSKNTSAVKPAAENKKISAVTPAASPLSKKAIQTPQKTRVQPQKENEKQLPVPEKKNDSPIAKIEKPHKKAPYAGTLIFVFDDAGHNLAHLECFLRLPFPCTIAVLPQLRYSAESAHRIRKAGKQVILHQPMQSLDPHIDPGPGAVVPGLTTEQIKEIVRKNLEEIWPVAGMNNHEGSLITEDPVAMKAVLEVVAEKNIFFLDSRTTARSVVPRVAQEQKMAVFERAVFLDNEKNRQAMKIQIEKGMSVARQKGTAILIGHVFTTELAALLTDMYPLFIEEGFLLSSIAGTTQKRNEK